MSTLKVNTLEEATAGGATFFTAKAWVTFDGTGTVAIRADGNVSSITDLAVGRFQSNFSTAISDANFVANSDTNFDDGAMSGTRLDGAGLTSNIIVEVMRESNGATAFRDATYTYVLVTR
jgi:hypothetical protein